MWTASSTATKATNVSLGSLILENDGTTQSFNVETNADHNSISALETDTTSKNENFKQKVSFSNGLMKVDVASVFANQTTTHSYKTLPKA